MDPDSDWATGWASSAGTLWDLALAPDGQLIAVSGADGSVQIFAQHSLAPLRLLPGKGQPRFSLSFSPDSRLLATCDYAGLVSLFDPATGTLKQNFQLGSSCEKLRFSASGVLALSGMTATGTQGLWLYFPGERKLSKPLINEPYSQRSITALAFSPDGGLLAVGSANHKHGVELFQVQGLGLKSLRKLASAGDISALAFSPDGRYIAGGGTERMVSLWNSQTGQRFWHVPWRTGAMAYLSAVAFAPDGKTLAACGMGSGAPVRLYRTGNGQAAGELGDSVSMSCTGVSYAPDGKSLVTIRQSYSDFKEQVLTRYRVGP